MQVSVYQQPTLLRANINIWRRKQEDCSETHVLLDPFFTTHCYVGSKNDRWSEAIHLQETGFCALCRGNLLSGAGNVQVLWFAFCANSKATCTLLRCILCVLLSSVVCCYVCVALVRGVVGVLRTVSSTTWKRKYSCPWIFPLLTCTLCLPK